MFAVVAATHDALGSSPCTTASTYCFVARSKAATGSCVTVTLVKPAGVNDVPPSAIFVVPSVTAPSPPSPAHRPRTTLPSSCTPAVPPASPRSAVI